MPAEPPEAAEPIVPVDRLIGAEEPQRIREFVQYWMSKRGDGRMPAFTDIDPVEIPWALSQIYIVEAKADGDFVYRLAGEAIAQRYDRSLKGARISDLFAEQSSSKILERWRRVIDEPVGYYSFTSHPSKQGVTLRARRVLLPLGKDRITADHLVGFTVFEDIQNSRSLFSDGMITRDIRWADLSR